MKYCLYCGSRQEENITWSSLFAKEKGENRFCRDCLEKLAPITGIRCQICSRPLSEISSSSCSDCRRWEEDSLWQGVLTQNTSLYQYNDFLKELLARFKYRGDYILIEGFKAALAEALKALEFDLAVPIPLSSERLAERGFNQSEAGISAIGLESFYALKRTHSEKQSKKTRQERMRHAQVFSLLDGVNITGKSILLFDDIYTTGSTLRHAAKVLKVNGAARVSSLTLARG
ncbi:ComF family protein [Peribacillus sp. SCS-37]|uniref:ComF family protein n=1 Tax=Paraperibacillus esterisolvens TaxID=3115296 RepID=UPI0039062C6A